MGNPEPNRRAIAQPPAHTAAEPSEANGGLPPLWDRLPAENRRQLAQQIARILQRLLRLSPRSEENHCADHDVVG